MTEFSWQLTLYLQMLVLTTDQASFLARVVEDLAYFDAATFSSTFLTTPPRRSPAGRILSSGIFDSAIVGPRAKAKASARATVRKIFEEQGHKRCLQHLKCWSL